MNIEKCNALKVLGFKYITRDMDGDLLAWENKPQRSLSIIEGYEEEVKLRYPDAIIYDIDTEKDEDCNYDGGYNIDYCCFTRSEDDNDDSSILHIRKSDTDYNEVTWENSPYEL